METYFRHLYNRDSQGNVVPDNAWPFPWKFLSNCQNASKHVSKEILATKVKTSIITL